MSDYHINVFYSNQDGGYIADIPDLKYCSAFGETPEEALREVMLAKVAWLEAARAGGMSVPAPRCRPAIYHRCPENGPDGWAPPGASAAPPKREGKEVRTGGGSHSIHNRST